MKFLFFSFVVVVAFFGRFDPYANAFRIDTSYKFSEQQMSIGKLKTMYNSMTSMSVCLGVCTCVRGFDVVLVVKDVTTTFQRGITSSTAGAISSDWSTDCGRFAITLPVPQTVLL